MRTCPLNRNDVRKANVPKGAYVCRKRNPYRAEPVNKLKTFLVRREELGEKCVPWGDRCSPVHPLVGQMAFASYRNNSAANNDRHGGLCFSLVTRTDELSGGWLGGGQLGSPARHVPALPPAVFGLDAHSPRRAGCPTSGHAEGRAKDAASWSSPFKRSSCSDLRMHPMYLHFRRRGLPIPPVEHN